MQGTGPLGWGNVDLGSGQQSEQFHVQPHSGPAVQQGQANIHIFTFLSVI